MKRKIAVLLAALMLSTAAPMMGVAAASSNTMSTTLRNLPVNTLVMQEMGIESGTLRENEIGFDYVSYGTALIINMGENENDVLNPDSTIELELTSNAEWFFAKGAKIDALEKSAWDPKDRDMPEATFSVYDPEKEYLPREIAFAPDPDGWVDSSAGYDVYGKLTAYRGGEKCFTIEINRNRREQALVVMHTTIAQEENFYVPVVMKSIEEGDILLDVSGKNLTTSTERLHAESTVAGIRASIKSAKIGRNDIHLDRIDLDETTANTLGDGGYIQLALPEGYHFTSEATLQTSVGMNVLAEEVYLNTAKNIMTIMVKLDRYSTDMRGTLYIEDLIIEPDENMDYFNKNVSLKIKGTTSYYDADKLIFDENAPLIRMSEAEIIVGRFMDYGTTIEFSRTSDRAVEGYSGKAVVSAGVENDGDTAAIVLSEDTPMSWFMGRGMVIELTDAEGHWLKGVKIDSIEIADVENIPALEERVYDRRSEVDRLRFAASGGRAALPPPTYRRE
jgi:hypothetical protein